MGQIAAKYADEVIITSDNPRSEDPLKIIEEIAAPLKASGTRYISEVSREEAMKYCVSHMGENDLCFVAGRGDEEFQIMGDQKIPFRDSVVLKRLCGL
jgi:UDP-N-acetylmuramoyl-L-alanyl-D-glutamate--2,6-diaminopimelate ligase